MKVPLLKFIYIAIATSLVFFLLISPTLAFSKDMMISPFFTRNLSPVVQIFGLPPAEGGFIVPQGQTNLRLALEIANNFTSNESSSESIILDGETSRLAFSLRYGLGQRWEAGVDLPVVSHNGGIFDGFIENWHDFFGLPQGGREGTPRGRLDYRYNQNGGGAELNFSDSGTGFGDVVFLLAYQLSGYESESQRSLAVRGGVKLPSGNADNLRGSGGTDLHLRLAATDAESLKIYDITLFASAGLMWLSRGDVLSDKQRQWVGFGSVGLGWSPLPWLAFKIQADGHTAFFNNSQFEQLDSASAQLGVGGTVQLSDKDTLDLCVSEDIVVDTAPDVNFHVALTHKF